MNLQTNVVKRALSFLSNLKNNEIQEGLISLVKKDNFLYGRVVDKQGKFHLSSILSTECSEDFSDIVINAKPLEDSLSSYDEDFFTFETDSNKVDIHTDMEVSFPVFDKNRVHTFVDNVENFGECLGTFENVFNSDLNKIIKEYLYFTNGNGFPYVYLKDKASSTNQTCVRLSKSSFAFPYTIHIEGFLHKVIKDMNNPSISFYEDLFMINDGFSKIMVARDRNADNMYETYLKNTSVLSVPTFFSFNAKKMEEALSKIKYFINKTGNNKIKIDIANNEIYYVEGEQKVRVPFQFTKNGNFTYKYVKFTDFYPVVSFSDEDIKVISGESPHSDSPENTEPFLSWETDKETVIIAPFVE